MIDVVLLFQKSGLREGMHIADLGCGRTGNIVFPAAHTVGGFGVVYAVDVLKDVLKNIQKRAANDGFVNIHTVWANIEKLGKTAIPSGSLDIVFLVNTLVQSQHRHEMLEEATRLLRDKSRLVVVDWASGNLPFGPKNGETVDFEDVKTWGRKNHFALQEEFDAGMYHKGVIFFKHD